jgi:hypothetical protein
MSDWIVKITGAKMPASCRSAYSVVRVLEVTAGVTDVKSVRSKEVLRVVHESVAVPAGGTAAHSGRQRALARAEGIVARRWEIEEKARVEKIEAAQRRAEIAQREHDESLESRRAHQDAIAAKLERGERLSPAEFASL